ncbi:MAG: Na/Pi cotransporter family protein [Treponema sp.]|jgi:phosphate:Na+ symporter|nr:Na/Pi cotransporter family protein [Treponema sp.]
MAVISTVFGITGGLCLFLYGMKIMSDGIQQTAGDRLQRVLSFMTGNRFTGVLTGFVVTAIIQSSSATTVMVVSFVNAGLLTLTQSIGVIMGANVGTTVTAWIVSLVGFSLQISALALPAVGIGFIIRIIKWKHQNLGEVILGFGLLFLGLDFLTKSMPSLGDSVSIIARMSNLGFFSVLIGAGAGLLMTLITHSSSASTAIMLTMAFNGVVDYRMAASMILGANIGTTIDAALASIGTRTAAKQAALVHVLFNVIGTLWALPLLGPLLVLVELVTPGTVVPGMVRDPVIPAHLAMLHTVFNAVNTLLFFPFVKPFAALVSIIVKDDKPAPASKHYRLVYRAASIQDTPELNTLRAEKEIRDMAGIVSSMYVRFSGVLKTLKETGDKEKAVAELVAEMKEKEEYADEMREVLTSFLIECTREQLNPRSEYRVSQLLRIIGDLEDMTDDCYSVSLLLERSVKKNHIFQEKEMAALSPYVGLVEEFLSLLRDQLGRTPGPEQLEYARDLEEKIDSSRNKLRKLGRKRIEAGVDVKTELLFIDLVRRIEKIGDYCFDITAALSPQGAIPRRGVPGLSS